jgi:hypothetical protein
MNGICTSLEEALKIHRDGQKEGFVAGVAAAVTIHWLWKNHRPTLPEKYFKTRNSES